MKIYPILQTDTTNSSCFYLFIANTVCVLPVNDYGTKQCSFMTRKPSTEHTDKMATISANPTILN